MCIYGNLNYSINLLLLLWNLLLVILFIDVEPQSVHSQPQLCSFLILDVEVVDSVHLEILSNLQILHHGFLSVDKREVSLTNAPERLIKAWKCWSSETLKHRVVYSLPDADQATHTLSDNTNLRVAYPEDVFNVQQQGWKQALMKTLIKS